MKTYSAASGTLERCLAVALATYHMPRLENVTLSALFVFDDEKSDEPVLNHQGYPAGAVIRITPIRDRALGVTDAVIVVDRAVWMDLDERESIAVLDHELTHLKRKINPKTNKPMHDAIGRPKLVMRTHDHQLGWFDEVAARHGEASAEIRQARQLIEQTNQLYFDFGPPADSRARRAMMGAIDPKTIRPAG